MFPSGSFVLPFGQAELGCSQGARPLGPRQDAQSFLGMYALGGALRTSCARGLFKHMDGSECLLQHLVMPFNETTGNEVGFFFFFHSFGLNF